MESAATDIRNDRITVTDTFTEPLLSQHPAVSWRSILGGTLVALLIFGIMMSLGIALGGVSLQDGASMQNAGAYGAFWILLSIAVSLGLSSYFAARISNFSSRRIGMSEGVVVAALFFGIVLWQAVGAMNWMVSSTASIISGAAQVAAPVAADSASNLSSQIGLNDLIEDNLDGVTFRTEPRAVVGGVATRLLRGDTESAKNYLARNTNLSREEIDARIMQLSSQVNDSMIRGREAAAATMKTSGWSLFAMFIVGLIASVVGGGLGSGVNRTVPMTTDIPRRGKNLRSAYT